MILPLELRDDWGTYQTTLVEMVPNRQIRYIESAVNQDGVEEPHLYTDGFGRFVVLTLVRRKFLGIPFGPPKWEPYADRSGGMVEIERYPSVEAARAFVAALL